MAKSKLISISVNELKPGMRVHSIGKQTGNLKVKHVGKIKHDVVIAQLINSGVETVVIEQASLNIKHDIEQRHDQHSSIVKPVAGNATTAKPIENTNKSSPLVAQRLLSDPEENIRLASTVLKKLKNNFNKAKLKVRNGLKIEQTLVEDAADEIVEMLQQNREALLFVSMLPDNDEYLNTHAIHCAILLCHFAKNLGFSEIDCKRMAVIGFLFDIGLSKIPDKLAGQVERPTKEEQIALQSHVQHSLGFAEGLCLDNEQLLAIEQHHERLDGTGYPYGLDGEQIHLYARMLAIVDCFDSMTAKRPFTRPLSAASALKVICDKHYGFDQKLAVKFLRCVGIYPVGCAVALDNQKIALVIKVKENEPLKPTVKTVYCTKGNYFCDQEVFDLYEEGSLVKIVKPVVPQQYGIDLKVALAELA